MSNVSCLYNIYRSLTVIAIRSLVFYIEVGGYSPSYCPRSSRLHESVRVQYSSNGGITWTDAVVIQFSSSQETYTLPRDAKKPSTRFRWWQASNSGFGTDIWSIDEIYFSVRQSSNSTEIVENFNSINLDVWTNRHGSTVGSSVCDSPQYAPSLQFFGASSQRFLRSGNFLLGSGAVIQFSMLMVATQPLHPTAPSIFSIPGTEDTIGNMYKLLAKRIMSAHTSAMPAYITQTVLQHGRE